MYNIGLAYHSDKNEKALAWFILAAMENNSKAQNTIGILYYYGDGVPQNYLCALKWYLKAAEQCEYANTPNNIGWLFEDGYGVPLDKYKAVEWYYHEGNKFHLDRLKGEGYHLSATDKSKSNSTIDSLY
jgi:TPR repeat protein